MRSSFFVNKEETGPDHLSYDQKHTKKIPTSTLKLMYNGILLALIRKSGAN